jgi:hypothetical protein
VLLSRWSRSTPSWRLEYGKILSRHHATLLACRTLLAIIRGPQAAFDGLASELVEVSVNDASVHMLYESDAVAELTLEGTVARKLEVPRGVAIGFQ